MTNDDIRLERLREVLALDESRWKFLWAKPTSNRVKAGQAAGRNNGKGYLRISIDGKNYYAHRLMWFWIYGQMPNLEIDHIDGNRSNNAPWNLRLAEHRQNSQNQGLRATNKSGFHGVSWCKHLSKWVACIHVAGKKRHLGVFSDASDAALAYLVAKRQAHPFQPVPRDAVIA